MSIWMKRMLRFSIIGAILALLGTIAAMLAARNAGPPASLGVRAGGLAPCSAAPNCVSTSTLDPAQAIAPVPFTIDPDEARAVILDLLASEPRTTLVRADEDYIHALYRSPTIGFPDDTEFYIDTSAGVIQMRAAARMGYSDLGANRARMERISAALAPRVRR
jgi:uncharacterized protein (DUF1499 family)